MKNLSSTIILTIVLSYACNFKASDSIAKKEVPSSNVSSEAHIQRIVCFRFKPNVSEEAKRHHMQGFALLKDSIPYILSYHAGTTVKGDLEARPEYDVMHYCTYRNEEEIKLYAIHPVHLRFIEENKNIWEKVLVINSIIEKK